MEDLPEFYEHSTSAIKKPLLTDLSELQIYRMGEFLDAISVATKKGNFRDLANMYNIEIEEIEKIAKRPSPTERVVLTIIDRFPNTTIEDLQTKCRLIRRFDVHHYLGQAADDLVYGVYGPTKIVLV